MVLNNNNYHHYYHYQNERILATVTRISFCVFSVCLKLNVHHLMPTTTVMPFIYQQLNSSTSNHSQEKL